MCKSQVWGRCDRSKWCPRIQSHCDGTLTYTTTPGNLVSAQPVLEVKRGLGIDVRNENEEIAIAALDIEINQVIRQLEELRIIRREFEEDIDLREAGLIQRLSVLRRWDIPIENGLQTRSSNDRLSSSSNDTAETNQEAADQGIVREYSIAATRAGPGRSTPSTLTNIASPRDVNVGDRVRIVNRINHAIGTETEEDRLATVTKVNRIRVQIKTDSGHKTSRIRSNLQLVLSYHEHP